MTPAIDEVKKYKLVHKVHAYTHDPKATSYGLEAATLLGVDPVCVFKTLVVELNTQQLAVAIVPVNEMLNMKSMAKALDAKKAQMADKNKVQRATGYVLGGVSPMGQKKRLPTVIDASAQHFSTIFVSAGKRGLEIEISPLDLQMLTNASFVLLV